MHETFWNSRGAGSPSPDRSPASGAGEKADGSGCGGGFQRFVGEPLEGRTGTARLPRAAVQAACRPSAAIEPAATPTFAGGAAARCCALGLCHAGLDVPAGEAVDRGLVRSA